jgi:hypothetical protein
MSAQSPRAERVHNAQRWKTAQNAVARDEDYEGEGKVLDVSTSGCRLSSSETLVLGKLSSSPSSLRIISGDADR